MGGIAIIVGGQCSELTRFTAGGKNSAGDEFMEDSRFKEERRAKSYNVSGTPSLSAWISELCQRFCLKMRSNSSKLTSSFRAGGRRYSEITKSVSIVPTMGKILSWNAKSGANFDHIAGKPSIMSRQSLQTPLNYTVVESQICSTPKTLSVICEIAIRQMLCNISVGTR
ncbi:hypothetical protein L218DRAFT_1007148 [Marasmius fiardii PR-910]|nr:hypothetical protein L218DRAFT_1007148 [Marasmius fiardii PR-910]